MAKDYEKQWTKLWLLISFLVVLLVIAIILMANTEDVILLKTIGALFSNLWWIVLPIPIYLVFRMIWDEYAFLKWISKQERVLLEIVPPADTEKSPKLMESIYAGLFSYSGINKFEKYCYWRPMQDKFSFEIASLEGKVHFYIRCPKMMRNNVEAQIYAQYPDAEIFEVEDYTQKVPRNLPNRDWDVWGSVVKLVDRDELPIRGYKYFQEDITGKMIDPLASAVEVMGSLGKGQHMWFQVMFEPAGEGEWRPKAEKYLAELCGEKEVKNAGFFGRIWAELMVLPSNLARTLMVWELITPPGLETPEKKTFNINELTPREQEKVKAVYENISKPGFKTLMRFVYVGKRDGFNKALGVSGFWGAMKQFNDVNLNGLMPHPDSKTYALYYYDQARLAYRQRKVVQDYRDRAGNYETYIFNTEELATVFHFPDMSVKTPTMSRIEAKKGEAPANLPLDDEIIFETSR